ncbi:MAG: hypothetical protein WCV90_06505 [Candidatus Woesearchaeota archaeon]
MDDNQRLKRNLLGLKIVTGAMVLLALGAGAGAFYQAIRVDEQDKHLDKILALEKQFEPCAKEHQALDDKLNTHVSALTEAFEKGYTSGSVFSYHIGKVEEVAQGYSKWSSQCRGLQQQALTALAEYRREFPEQK